MAAQLSFPITTDTYLDSRIGNDSQNYGAANTVKVLINNNATGDGSICRGLFRLPAELGLFEPGEIVEAKVLLYVWQDNTADLDITLFPLKQNFVEGTGSADGATWNTYDGTNAWLNLGGDFDTNNPVLGVKEEILDPDMHDRFFSWNIAALLTNETARNEVMANGALLQIDEVQPPSTGNPRAPFTSSEASFYDAAYRPHVQLTVIPRTPDIPQLSIAGGQIALDIAHCTPFVTNRIERTLDLTQSNGWTLVTNMVSTGSSTNWTENLQPGWTNVFYRIRIPE